MGSMSVWHWVVVGLVVLLLFGRGKISEFMGDAAKGIKAFKKGLAEDEPKPGETAPATAAGPATTIDHKPVDAAQAQPQAAQAPKAG